MASESSELRGGSTSRSDEPSCNPTSQNVELQYDGEKPQNGGTEEAAALPVLDGVRQDFVANAWQGKAPRHDFDRHVAVEVVCEHCGARVMRAQRAPWKPKQRYCSRECAGAAAAALGKFKGEKNPRFAGWKSRDKVAYREKFQARYPEKAAAHKAVMNAKRRGELIPAPCESCGASSVQAHHDDYSKPLDVRWLCRRCHREWHEINGSPMGGRPLRTKPTGGAFVWRGVRREW
jgi:ribosomal protein S27AE